MQRRRDNIHDSAPLRRLVGDQVRALAPRLQRCFGTHGLALGAGVEAVAPALPMLANWTALRVAGDRYAGDVLAAVDEPLPFVDDAFDLVLLCHALESVPHASALLDEAVRVLAPGGTLALGGMHPLSGWAPWFYWHARGTPLALRTPLRVGSELRRAGLEVEQVLRTGNVLPGLAAAREVPTSLLGGGYVLIARKRRRMVTPLRIKPAPVRVPASGRLSPGTRRSAVS